MNALSKYNVNIPNANILESHEIDSLGVAMAVVEVNRKLAASLLELLPKNQRNVSDANIKRLSRSLDSGFWNEKNCDPLRFDTNGSLIDGQHRLLMMRGANRPVKFVVIAGCNTESIASIDTGKPRSLSDVLKINGYSNYCKASAVVSSIVSYLNNDFGNRRGMNVSECLLFMKKHTAKIYEAVKYAEMAKLYLPVSIAGLLYYEYAKIDKEGAQQAFKEFRVSSGRCNAIDKLKTLMLQFQQNKNMNHKRGIKVSTTWKLAVSIKAFNAFFVGDDIGILRWIGNEDMPEINTMWI